MCDFIVSGLVCKKKDKFVKKKNDKIKIKKNKMKWKEKKNAILYSR